MKVVYERCCGIDVHKKEIVASLKRGRKRELRKFSTFTKDLKELANWLLENKCQKVAMESTGSYWKPIYNILELFGLDIIVVNAHHLKIVPGRKTDVKDAEWIADLLQHGLLKASFIPNREQRELRDIVRYRKNMVEERARELNRLEKTLQGNNIKLSSVTKLDTMSGRNLIEHILTGEVNDENIESLIHCSMYKKKEDLIVAMEGNVSPIQKKLIESIINHIDDMTQRIKDLDKIVDSYMEKYQEDIERLEELPGVGKRSAEVIIAEVGANIDRFPTASHLASWIGLCPGDNESAGKRKHGKTRKGNKILKTTLIQSAKTAKKKDSFFHAQYQRIVVRRGANRATVAVAHSMIIACYHMIKKQERYKDLGSDYYTKFNTNAKIHYYKKKLQDLGVSVPAMST